MSVLGRTAGDLRRAAADADEADLVELRLDSMDRPDAAAALAGRTRPAIVTCRPVWEGGRFDGSEEERRRILLDALAAGAEFVDVEAAAPFAAEVIASRNGRGVVVSAHLFGPVPSDLAERYGELRAHGAEIVKLAITAATLEDTLTLFAIADAGRDRPGDHVLLAMGPAGVPTRILAARLRNRWTYAGDGVAPGQLPAARLIREYGFRRIAGDADVYGVAGSPVLHSRSPAMHNAGFAAANVNAVYVPLEAASVDDFARFARALRLRGASVTAPFKTAILPIVDQLDPLAARAGAVNTLTARDGRWLGANTDIAGLIAPLRRRLALRGVRATVLGAGGAARAAAVALAEDGAQVSISARQRSAAEAVAAIVGGAAAGFPPPAGSWDVLVNTIPFSADAPNPLAGEPLDGRLVFDLNYAPAATPLLDAAQGRGLLTIGGLEMLVAQAERQFELWTGRRPAPGLFHAAATGTPVLRAALDTTDTAV